MITWSDFYSVHFSSLCVCVCASYEWATVLNQLRDRKFMRAHCNVILDLHVTPKTEFNWGEKKFVYISYVNNCVNSIQQARGYRRFRDSTGIRGSQPNCWHCSTRARHHGRNGCGTGGEFSSPIGDGLDTVPYERGDSSQRRRLEFWHSDHWGIRHSGVLLFRVQQYSQSFGNCEKSGLYVFPRGQRGAQIHAGHSCCVGGWEKYERWT